jgi:hypothetical protein
MRGGAVPSKIDHKPPRPKPQAAPRSPRERAPDGADAPGAVAGSEPSDAPDSHDLVLRMGELFASAAQVQRAHMIACLLHPLNTLGRAGIAAGAFAEFLTRRPRSDDPRDLDAVSRISADDVSQLSDFVDQIDHEAVVRAARAATLGDRTKRRGSA